jgi:hypothetical protein
MEIELLTIGPQERWELYQRAKEMGLFHKLPPQPKPLSQPLVHLYTLGGEKQLNPFLWSNRPDLSDDDKRASMYAWHVWRERTDIWEMPSWGDLEYHPAWVSDGTWNFLMYRQFLSAFELERYIVNPWVRASAWITALNLLDLEVPPKFDMLATGGSLRANKAERKYTRSHVHFQEYVNQVPTWWVNQKQSGHFGPVPELSLATSGFVSVALRDGVTSPQPDELVEGSWHTGAGNKLVMSQKRSSFSWEEFMYRRDELNFVLPMVISQMIGLGPKGASVGAGCRQVVGKSEGHLWAMEKKLLNRLAKRVDTMRRYADAIGEVADGQRA